ncbi:murein L,D-transpeptidase catalytic domain family protein [Oleiagrimonas soli]|uniref:murein L,D-transpeptidase catalytic domain family protein n=1 Tax=Oleiagrimonas soli TaxID=1543381 RepID=UPI003CCDB936
MSWFRLVVLLVLTGTGAFAQASDRGSDRALAVDLARAAPQANPRVIALATRALKCVSRHRTVRTLSVIDYSLPSTTPRLWVFDLPHRTVLFHVLVAHGRNTGGQYARHFSNREGSLMSSLGTFVTDGTYVGHNGYSLRLKGLDGRFNDQAEKRAIVIHGASYVSRQFAEAQGRLGRSWGCPAVRKSVAKPLIDAIRKQSVVFAYYPDKDWLQDAPTLADCPDASTGASSALAP